MVRSRDDILRGTVKFISPFGVVSMYIKYLKRLIFEGSIKQGIIEDQGLLPLDGCQIRDKLISIVTIIDALPSWQAIFLQRWCLPMN